MRSHITYIPERRTCDICKFEDGKPDVTATHDAKTNSGPWANVCEPHFKSHTPGVLGIGKAQFLVIGEEPPRDRKAEANEAARVGDFDAFMDAVGDGDPIDFL